MLQILYCCENLLGSLTVVATALARMGPMPGIVAERWLTDCSYASYQLFLEDRNPCFDLLDLRGEHLQARSIWSSDAAHLPWVTRLPA